MPDWKFAAIQVKHYGLKDNERVRQHLAAFFTRMSIGKPNVDDLQFAEALYEHLNGYK